MKLSCAAVAVVAALLFLPHTSFAQSAKEKAKAHFEQAEIYMKAGVYDKAIEEYQASYALAPTAHVLLFNIGLAYENWGKRQEAIEWYRRYQAADARGPKATEANARSIALERAIERDKQDAEARAQADAQRKKDEEAQRQASEESARRALAQPEPSQPVDSAPRKKEGIGWVWVAAGAAALATGIVLDVVPDSASNGKFDALDLLPIGLYGASATFLVVGVF